VKYEPTLESKAIKQLREQLARDEKAVADRAAADERERDRQHTLAMEKHARELAERARQREAEAKKLRDEITKFGAGAPLLCCDGTTSPTCTCGASRDGCCERHRGVCGCAAE
jgi:hypothetical protein